MSRKDSRASGAPKSSKRESKADSGVNALWKSVGKQRARYARADALLDALNDGGVAFNAALTADVSNSRECEPIKAEAKTAFHAMERKIKNHYGIKVDSKTPDITGEEERAFTEAFRKMLALLDNWKISSLKAYMPYWENARRAQWQIWDIYQSNSWRIEQVAEQLPNYDSSNVQVLETEFEGIKKNTDQRLRKNERDRNDALTTLRAAK